MFEPVHGSAPRFAGKNVANPIGAISSAALMLETLGLVDEARAVDAAVRAAISDGECTADAGGTLGTREAGDAIVITASLVGPKEFRDQGSGARIQNSQLSQAPA